MAIVERRSKKKGLRFQARVKDQDGHWFPSETFSNRADALKQEKELEKKKRLGGRVISNDAFEVTEAEYWAVWKETNRPETSEGWKLSQDQMHRDYIEPVLGSVLMGRIGAPEIAMVLRKMKEKGRGDQLRLHVYNLLNKMFSDAVVFYKMLAESPVSSCFHRPELKETKAQFLKPMELWQLLNFSRERGHYAAPAIWIESLAAPRAECTVAFKFKDVLWDLDLMVQCRAWKKKIGKLEDYSKTGTQDYVPVTPALKEYLWELWQKSGDPEAFICQGPKGGMLLYDTYLAALKSLCRGAGVPEVSTHELRHSCTELFTREGASAEDLRRLLNQKSLNATKRYIHRTDERLISLAKKVSPLRVIDGGGFDPVLGNQNSFPNGKQKACGEQEASIAQTN